MKRYALILIVALSAVLAGCGSTTSPAARTVSLKPACLTFKQTGAALSSGQPRDLVTYKHSVERLAAVTSGAGHGLASDAVRHLSTMLEIASTGASIPQATIAVVDDDARQLAELCAPLIR